MATSGEPPDGPSVLYVTGDRPPAALDGVAVERVGVDRAPVHVSHADCVVAEEPGGGLEALASIGETAVPTLLYDREGNPAVAARATRLGVTEYVTDAALEGETLADRVLAVADADYTRATSAFESLHAVATDRSLTLDEKIDRLLAVGRERLDLDLGFLTDVEDGASTVVAVSGDRKTVAPDVTMPLSETYCERTVETEGLLGIHDVTEEIDADDPVREAYGLRCYLGGRVVIDDELYGTLCFASDDPRPRRFSRQERRFVELLVEWLSYELQRDRRERTLRRYKAVHETVEEMVFVVGRGTRLELVTEPLLERFGYDRETLLGEPIASFLGDGAVEAGYEAFERLQDGAESVILETEISDADGRPVPVEVDLSLLSPSTEFEGLVGVVHDRTALTETRAELAAERDRFQSLFDQLPDAVVDKGVRRRRAVRPGRQPRLRGRLRVRRRLGRRRVSQRPHRPPGPPGDRPPGRPQRDGGGVRHGRG